jgi:poly(A) polymerase Pap1
MSTEDQQKHWGVTGSISFARPTEEEVRANHDLIEELKTQGSFETAEDTQKRYYHASAMVCVLLTRQSASAG